jgi:hypothetical protein
MFNAGQNIALQDLWRRYEEWARCPSCGSEQVAYVDPMYGKQIEYARTQPRRRIWESKSAYKRRFHAWWHRPGGPADETRETYKQAFAAKRQADETARRNSPAAVAARARLAESEAKLAEATARKVAAYAKADEDYLSLPPAGRAWVDESRRKRGLPPHPDAT